MRKIAFILSFLYCIPGQSQHEELSIQQAVDIALRNNEQLKAASYQLQSTQQLKKTSFDLPKTNVSLLYGQYNSFSRQDNNITITQTIPFASLGSQGQLNRALIISSELNKSSVENELVFKVKQVYYQIAFHRARHQLLLQEDSILEGFLRAASARYLAGEANLLEKTTAETQHNEIENKLLENDASVNILRLQMKALLNDTSLPTIGGDTLTRIQPEGLPDSSAIQSNPSIAFSRQQVEVAHRYKKVEAAQLAPDLLVGYFNQTLIGAVNTETGSIANNGDRFSGVQVGLSVPLWFVPFQGRAKAAELAERSAASKYKYEEIQFQSALQQATQLHTKYSQSLEYYDTSALPNANLILRQFHTAFQNGEIGFAEYLLAVRSALGIKERYLQTLSEYNQNIIYMQYLGGNR
jgi:cobalt-zinc-cadmium resistance protein CzcA